MNQVLKRFGVDEDDLVDADKVRYPKAIPGRVAHVDADFMAYQASAESSDEMSGVKPRKTVDAMCDRAKRGIEHLMRLCAAETFIAHITPSGSNKGHRDEQAVTLPYQGNRKDRPRPEHLDAVRHYIGTELPSCVHLDQEADDGMAQANYAALDGGTGELSVIVSKDKDLRMVPGLHWDFDTETVVTVGDPFGYIWIKETTNKDGKVTARTMRGWGTMFFWAQLLMGDTADNIRGLPAISHGSLWANNLSTKATDKLVKQLSLAKGDDRARIDHLLDLEINKTKTVGAVMAFNLLADMKNDADCYKLIRQLFLDLGEVQDFTHHATGAVVSPTVAMFGDMQLLWMRRTTDARDVLAWLKEYVL